MTTKTAGRIELSFAKLRELYEGGGHQPPVEPPAFDRNPSGWGFPLWASHLGLFTAGFITANVLYLAPMFLPILLLIFASCFILLAVVGTRRWF